LAAGRFFLACSPGLPGAAPGWQSHPPLPLATIQAFLFFSLKYPLNYLRFCNQKQQHLAHGLLSARHCPLALVDFKQQ
jgi:hypothetical protein